MACNNLKAELARRDITICAVAQLLGTSRDTVSNKISGDSTFSIEQAQLIRDTYFPGMSLEYLFEREGEA